MELDIECTPIMPPNKIMEANSTKKNGTFVLAKPKFYLFINGYPYIVLVPHAVAFTIGINSLTLFICGLSMLVIDWTWVSWLLLAIQLLSYNITSLINPGTPRNTGNKGALCKICNSYMTSDSAHCFKCGICVESICLFRI